MATTNPVILDALNDLLEAEFKEFKQHLSNDSSISRAKLENADRQEFADLLVQRFGSADAGRMAVRVLRRINQNDCADSLKEKLKEAVSKDVEASSSPANVNAPTSGDKISINSSNGGSVKAPVVQGGVFNSSVTFN